jgi:hypothetical protein
LIRNGVCIGISGRGRLRRAINPVHTHVRSANNFLSRGSAIGNIFVSVVLRPSQETTGEPTVVSFKFVELEREVSQYEGRGFWFGSVNTGSEASPNAVHVKNRQSPLERIGGSVDHTRVKSSIESVAVWLGVRRPTFYWLGLSDNAWD